MIITVKNETPFQVLTGSFTIGPSTTGYELQVGATSRDFTTLFSVGANTPRMVTNVAPGSYYRLKNNSGNVKVNWERTCDSGGSGGGGNAGELEPVTEFPLGAAEGTVVALVSGDTMGVYQYDGEEWIPVAGDMSQYALAADVNDFERVTATALTELHDSILDIEDAIETKEEVVASAITELHNQVLEISGSTGGGGFVEVTKAEYEALDPPQSGVTYIITDADVVDLDDLTPNVLIPVTELPATADTGTVMALYAPNSTVEYAIWDLTGNKAVFKAADGYCFNPTPGKEAITYSGTVATFTTNDQSLVTISYVIDGSYGPSLYYEMPGQSGVMPLKSGYWSQDIALGNGNSVRLEYNDTDKTAELFIANSGQYIAPWSDIPDFTSNSLAEVKNVLGLYQYNGSRWNDYSKKADASNVTPNNSSRYFPSWNEQGIITGTVDYPHEYAVGMNGNTVSYIWNSGYGGFNFYSPETAGTSGQPLLSDGTKPVWGSYKFQFITQTAYDALVTPDASTIYFIIGD